MDENVDESLKDGESEIKEDLTHQKEKKETKSIAKIKIGGDKKMDCSKNMEGDCMSSKNVVFYGDVNEVNSLGNYSYDEYIKLAPKSQKMEGFDDCYDNFVDYILKITHWIWEERGMGVIYDTYAPSVVMHLGSSNLCGVKDVIANTLGTLHSFPDRRQVLNCIFQMIISCKWDI